MKKNTKIILSLLVFVALIAGYEYLVQLWSRFQTTPVIRTDIFFMYPLFIGISLLFYYILGKIKKHHKWFVFTVLALIGIVVAGVSLSPIVGPSEAFIRKYISEKNMEIDTISNQIKEKLPGLPENIFKKIVLLGNPEAKTVLINAQGGPMTSLQNFELNAMLKDAGFKAEDLLIVNVHQYQTLRTDEFETKLIDFEDAKKYDAESTKMLAEVVDYFKNKGNKVIVLDGLPVVMTDREVVKRVNE